MLEHIARRPVPTRGEGRWYGLTAQRPPPEPNAYAASVGAVIPRAAAATEAARS
jgi:hypothetical protein